MKKSTLCLLLILALLLSACAQAAPQPQAESAAGQIAAPVYPEMAPYPDEMSFLDEKSGEFDSDGMDAAYTAWREDRQKQYSQPEGYADSLAPFFSSSIPVELEEAAEIDGCSPLQTFLKIVLPLSKAMLSVITLYYAVGRWNGYTTSLYYQPTTPEYHSLQMVLRRILLQAKHVYDVDPEMAEYFAKIANQLKYAAIVVASVPLLVVYPFLQKYFEKGVMIGSVKG